MSKAAPTIVWLRQDLRLQDHAALAAAVDRGEAVVPVYILDDAAEGAWAMGGASRWWLHHSLTALAAAIQERSGRLIVRQGNSAEVLGQLIKELGAGALYWTRRYEPAIIERDKHIKEALTRDGLEVRSFNGALLHEPHTVQNKQGKPFQVFTPYWRHCLDMDQPKVGPGAPKEWPRPGQWPDSLEVADLKLLPKLDWADGFGDRWTPGEAGAQAALREFMGDAVDDYDGQRDFPGVHGTSRLSPHLHFGEISPAQIWAAAEEKGRSRGVFPTSKGARVFLSEVGWREFAYHLIYHFPHTPTQPLREEFADFPWADDPGGHKLKAWQRGQTGYPIVDAGMRELWATGWMHNRVRMVVASFLVKHLRRPWQKGAEWFWDTLVDADLAANTLGWQWTSGCGADAAPYFRIFAPVLQGNKFDGDGDYVRRWVPELAKLPDKYLQAPWEAPAEVLEYAGVDLGGNYPEPVVDHKQARDAALAAYQELKKN
ncbi:cryptochrome/photolyase family protein [Actomonas aquatica]|uniref:Deoxyribodipyrimidine photo-lyase n=1 Tax=Actomonas aquatica TaxID=2866162 RepID=A0ABZ1CA83_9BACT|nr:deoxyribodipyrimidine photo-lyase [Opitutus sp. WL0086]WRQ88413.1 deoxyribodipyrimidine photo-lyase [Opitutus sp. WL0086]